jgi:hypothetical protein
VRPEAESAGSEKSARPIAVISATVGRRSKDVASKGVVSAAACRASPARMQGSRCLIASTAESILVAGT